LFLVVPFLALQAWFIVTFLIPKSVASSSAHYLTTVKSTVVYIRSRARSLPLSMLTFFFEATGCLCRGFDVAMKMRMHVLDVLHGSGNGWMCGHDGWSATQGEYYY
jgi:hypothetical protein